MPLGASRHCHVPTNTTTLIAAVGPTCAVRHIVSEAMKGMNKKALTTEAINRAVFRRFSETDFQQIDRIYNAYMEYFNHIKFRKEWDKPKYKKEDVDMMFREAAEYVYRIRQHLDRLRPEGEQALRMVDGEAQRFLQSDTGPRLFRENGSSFVAHLVHATMSDARGYVEGLDADSVNLFIARLQHHRFSPAEHLRHVLLEAIDLLDTNKVESHNPDQPLHYLDEGSPEDKAWRASINAAYDSTEAIKRALELREKTAKAAAEALEQQKAAEAAGFTTPQDTTTGGDGQPQAQQPPQQQQQGGSTATPS
jgi:hypothetical protein